MRRDLLIEEVGDVRAVVARLHHDLAGREDGPRVVDDVGELLLDRRGPVRRRARGVEEEVGEVVPDGDRGVRVRDRAVAELGRGLLRVPLDAEEGVPFGFFWCRNDFFLIVVSRRGGKKKTKNEKKKKSL